MSEYMSYNPGQEFKKPKEKKGQPIPEAEDISPYRAHSIFENAMINTINNELESSGQQIISSDGSVSLDWLVDEETPAGRFAIIKREVGKTSTKENEPKEYVLEKDPKTGEIYKVEKMSGPVEFQKDIATVYDLNTEQVRQVFNKLEPAVKKSFIDGLQESLAANIALVRKYNQELKGEKREEEEKELKTKIEEQELAQEKINKELKALA